MKNYSDFKKRLLKDKVVRRAYKQLEPEFAIAKIIIEKRLEKGLTQSEFAKKIGTKQSAISRLESGNYNPSLRFLEKVADALNLNFVISLSAKI
ncbi:MAG: transcriptional regulator, XRE family [uncultured bacterium]|nr:MAG: transcriptional regulator, XRE family [uncultured bacterium]OGJ46990.1 MAG: transcriptional regulator [Candidatus Peregrinibacteria bacterium RIFOXYA2_FULL_41_18]OGJ49408.1 MAG: transcriptional regulator [Candidatus Peregrinibacteria bacterium RIFOXYB12_FULL_41_12]OGJ53244.1 MAG: transcriptional regulator [Candidatus Peregrinibacteria bacterium RIFOXYB2_FULL_41_88]OGJ53639.1 MAG: transcriptional regulator [Candidatus Peregrinibacteria bacterium RIFOXYC2_FULL_41_22]